MCWGFNLPQKMAFDLLKAEYNPRCRPPSSDRDVLHKVEEAHTTNFGKPRGYLLDAPRNSGEFGDGSGGGPWEPPTPLPTLSPVPPFPLDVFPTQVTDY